MSHLGQLTFDDLVTNPTVLEQDSLRLSHQAWMIYKMLLKRPVANTELREVALQYNARILEIRRALEPLGLTVKIVQREEGGLNFYQVRRINEK